MYILIYIVFKSENITHRTMYSIFYWKKRWLKIKKLMETNMEYD